MTSKFLFWASPRIRPFCQPLHCQCLIRKQCLSYGKGLQGGKTFCKLLCIRPAGFSVCWLCLFVSFWESSDWDWMKYTRCERLLLIKPFLCFFLFTWKLHGLSTTNVEGKTDHSVSLKENKKFWTFPSGEGKRKNEFAEWHVDWLAEGHNYAEWNICRMT